MRLYTLKVMDLKGMRTDLSRTSVKVLVDFSIVGKNLIKEVDNRVSLPLNK